MPSRLSKILSRSSKEKEAEAKAERNASKSSSSSPPPEYAQAPPDYDAENRLVPPDVTAGFAKLNLNSANTDTPQVDQCVAHLKVLECFYRLRQTVGSKDGLFGIDNSIALGKGLPSSDQTPQVLAKLSEKRWAIYVSRAVDRFERWYESLLPNAYMLTTTEFAIFGKAGILCDPSKRQAPLLFTKNNMPPADVLMVWHAYMLNPRAYLEDCLRMGRMQLWHTGFPWHAAFDCINSETFAFEAGDEAAQNFANAAGLHWDQLNDLRTKEVKCPACFKTIKCAYTTAPEIASLRIGSYSTWDSLSLHVDDLLSSGTGFCDRQLVTVCPHCATDVTHDRLKVAKFWCDLQRLAAEDLPMGGTLLGYQGIPWRFGKVEDTMFLDFAVNGPFVSRFLKAGLVGDIRKLEAISSSQIRNMSGIRDQIEIRLSNKSYMRVVKANISGQVSKADRVSIRMMMSRYWENSSPFALDLVGAVIRQGSFIEKMHNIDWLHSPALQNTMKRLLVKYQRFVSIIKDEMHIAVPTLDVDLAWHTHQLSPYSYMKYTIDTTGRFIDHDDKVAETALNDGFAWTNKTYQKQYGEPYSECTCWHCEAIRESHTNTASRLLNRNNAQANEKLHDAEQDPRKSVHISAHNMVRPEEESYKLQASHKAEELEKAYQKACERARKKGRKEPKRDDYYWSDAYGYPVYIPAYSPYIGFYPYMPMYYPVTPGCMALTAGAAGNCCAGTCGGGVVAGSSGGGGGGCTRGATGGCGSGAAGGACVVNSGGCGGGCTFCATQ